MRILARLRVRDFHEVRHVELALSALSAARAHCWDQLIGIGEVPRSWDSLNFIASSFEMLGSHSGAHIAVCLLSRLPFRCTMRCEVMHRLFSPLQVLP